MDDLLAVTSRAEASHFWFRGFRAFIFPLIDQIARGQSSLRIVDCGCGTGHNLAFLKRYGRPVGLDLTAGGLRLAKARGVPLIQASIERLPFAANSVDLLTSFDVLQMIDDDGGVMREIHRVLRPGGVVVLTASAMRVLRGGHAAEWPEVRRYDRGRIRRIAGDAGLRVERAMYLFGALFPLMLGVRVFRRNAETNKAGGEDWEMNVPPAPVNAALAWALQAEAAITRRVPLAPAGSSVLLVARKPRT